MRIYYARASSTTQAEAFERAYMAAASGIRLKILLSFHYYQQTNLDELLEKKFAPHYPEIFIDSGGFSAATQGAQIDIHAYIAFLKKYGHRVAVYANLDVIGDAVATAANQARMEDAGLRPLPVFHTGEPWEQLEAYVERYPYVALGGLVPYMRRWRKIMPWLVRAFKVAKGRAVFHGFGATAWGMVKALPWYSVDSSSWSSSFRFGQVPLFDVRRGDWEMAQLGDPKTCHANAALIRAHGFDPADFADRSRNKRETISAISALAYIRAERWLRTRHGEIHIPVRAEAPPPCGPHIYLAGTAASAAHHRDAAHELGERGVDGPPEMGGPRVYLANTDELHFSRASTTLNEMARDGAAGGPPRAPGPSVYLADPATNGSAKDTAGASARLNGPHVFLADTSGAGACDTASATRRLNPEEPT